MTAPTVESVATLAGRELDAAVCERVFGEPVQWGGHRGDVPLWKGRDRIVPHHSTDPAAFFALMKKMRENGWNFIASDGGVRILNRSEAEEFDVDLYRLDPSSPSGEMCATGRGPTLLTALARAALLTTITPKGG